MIDHTRKVLLTMRDDKLREWLAEKVREDSLSHRELARRLRVSHTRVSTFLSGQELAGFEFCIALARYYKRDPLQVLNMGGLVLSYSGEDDATIDEVTQIMREFDESERLLVLEAIRGLARGIRRERESNDALDNYNDQHG